MAPFVDLLSLIISPFVLFVAVRLMTAAFYKSQREHFEKLRESRNIDVVKFLINMKGETIWQLNETDDGTTLMRCVMTSKEAVKTKIAGLQQIS